jgi:hypothetical protein
MIQILGWDHHQHFKDRKPLWIKLWVDLIDDPDNARRWYALSDSARSMLIELWLLTAKGKGYPEGILEADDDTIAWWTRRTLASTVKAIDELEHGQWLTRTLVDQLTLLDITEHNCTGLDETEQNKTQLNESSPRVISNSISNSNSNSNSKRGTVAQSPPSIDEVREYMLDYMAKKNASGPDPSEAFVDHFESNGWKVGGKAPMKDWKAAARTWIRNNIEWGKLKVDPAAEPGGDLWLYESYRQSDLEAHGDDPDWQCYIEWASDWCTEHGPRTAPPFKDFKGGLE